MINLSLNRLRLIPQYRNISDYENKSKEDLIKALSKRKPKLGINKKKVEEVRKYFYKLRHKFPKKQADKYRKVFYDIKNCTHLSEPEIEEIRKNFDELDYNYDFSDDDDEYRKIGSIRTLFKEFDRDYYKPIRTDGGFAGRNNNCIEYVSKGDLLPEEYLNMIRAYLRDLINEHITPMELNNNNNNNNNRKNSDNSNNNNNNDTDRAEWKIQLTMQNSCISTRSFEETRTIYTKSEPVEIFMGSNTEDVIDKRFNTLLQKLQRAQDTSNERGSEFIPDSAKLLYDYFQRIDIRRLQS